MADGGGEAAPTSARSRIRRTISTCEPVTLEEVRQMISRDLTASDMLYSSFYAAVRSYRRDTLVRPFPSHFKSEGAAADPHDFERLMAAAEDVPPLADLAGPNPPQGSQVPSGDALIMLGWLAGRCPLRLTTLSPELYNTIQAKSGAATYSLKPDYVFGVEQQEEDARSQRFDALAQEHGVITCYHGTALENFHSILMNGFLSHFNKAALYGEGTYFSSDLSVCMGFIQAGQAWGKSTIGSKLSCVAVCDVVKHPSVTLPGGIIERNLDRASSVGGDRAPDTYVVVPNNDHIRIKYLFVYAEQQARVGPPASSNSRRCCGGLRRVIAANRFAFSLLCYALMLLVVGLWNTRSVRRWISRMLR